MNKAFVAALACATTSAVKINATAQDFHMYDYTMSDICEAPQEELKEHFWFWN